MPKKDRQHDEYGGRQEFRLPVLEGFKPELWISKIARDRLNLPTMAEGFRIRSDHAEPPMQHEGRKEKQRESKAERVLIEPRAHRIAVRIT